MTHAYAHWNTRKHGHRGRVAANTAPTQTRAPAHMRARQQGGGHHIASGPLTPADEQQKETPGVVPDHSTAEAAVGVATSGAAAGMAWVHVAHPASQPHTHGDAHSKAGRDRRGVGDVETNNTHNEDDCEAHNATQQSPQALAKARTRTRAARGGKNARCLTQGVHPPLATQQRRCGHYKLQK